VPGAETVSSNAVAAECSAASGRRNLRRSPLTTSRIVVLPIEDSHQRITPLSTPAQSIWSRRITARDLGPCLTTSRATRIDMAERTGRRHDDRHRTKDRPRTRRTHPRAGAGGCGSPRRPDRDRSAPLTSGRGTRPAPGAHATFGLLVGLGSRAVWA
jgi:hypothetical protein